MAKSSGNKSSAAATRPPKSAGKGLIVLSLIFRLLLLGVGGGVAWVLGMAGAQFSPSTATQMPLAEKLLRQLETLTSGSKRLPSPPSPVLLSPTPLVSPQKQLNPAQKQKLRTELRQLQGELNALIGRTAALETELGSSRPTENLEQRLEVMSQQLASSETATSNSALPTIGDNTTPKTTASASNANQVITSNSPIFSGNALMVTLPSDVLFEQGSSVLRPGTNAILDNLIADLRSYEGATVRIAGHTDDVGEAIDNRNLSFARAQALQQYLSKSLGNDYHWVAIGYGESSPGVENSSEGNRQRNRRIEVAIAPKQ